MTNERRSRRPGRTRRGREPAARPPLTVLVVAGLFGALVLLLVAPPETWAPGPARGIARLGACAAVTAGLLLVLGMWLGRYEPGLMRDHRALVKYGLVCLSLPLFLRTWPMMDLWLEAVPVALTAMVLGITAGRRTAVATVALLLFIGAFPRLALGSPETGLPEFARVMLHLPPAVVAVFGVGRVPTRGHLILVGVWTGLTGAVAFAAAGALVLPTDAGVEAWRELGMRAGAAMLNGTAVGFVVLGILPLIERAFGVITDLSLHEYSMPSQNALLRRIDEEAPGTAHHSRLVGQMAEKAATAIGANELLCRVGALYHDCGKIMKPEYFIENQQGGPNPHDDLSPTMSTLVITAHPRDGMELAAEYGLPGQISQFINQHHGTTVVEYFYRKALGGDTAAVMETFRHGGPKPRTREAAIMMICDACEGISRTLDEPSPKSLQKMVHEVIMKRLTDGQFDECPITMADLGRVEDALVNYLVSFFHHRIKYQYQLERAARETEEEEAERLSEKRAREALRSGGEGGDAGAGDEDTAETAPVASNADDGDDEEDTGETGEADGSAGSAA